MEDSKGKINNNKSITILSIDGYQQTISEACNFTVSAEGDLFISKYSDRLDRVVTVSIHARGKWISATIVRSEM